MTEKILGFLQKKFVEHKKNISLSGLSTVKIGGVADCVAYPDSIEKLIGLIKFLESTKVKYKLVGRMSNVLPPDEGYRGVIIRTDRFDKVKCDGNRVIADMGISLPCLCGICRDMELSGIEELSGIPGSLGGAIYGNAGAYGREISDLINSVLVYDLESCRCYEISVREIDFGYRNSSFKTRPIVILSAELSLRYGDKNEIYARMRKIAEARRSTQPSGKPSLGSSFKRPEVNIYPWQLIDGCGLRGYRVGDAAVSQKHAGFIVNEESATTQDYLAVADRIQTSVKEKYGITLEREFELM